MPLWQQKLPVVQSGSPVQLVKHAPDPQTNGEQLTCAAVGHEPAPSQSAGWVSVVPVQLCALHWVDDEKPQAVDELPSQGPWHTPVPEHAPRAPCGCPVVTVWQWPTPVPPAMSHAWHLPLQAASQQ